MFRMRILVLILSVHRTVLGQPSDSPVVELVVTSAATAAPVVGDRLFHLPRNRRSGNAAISYYRAMALAVGWGPDNLQRIQNGMIPGDDDQSGTFYDDWLELPISDLPRESVRKELERFESCLEELHRASRCMTCEWQLKDRNDGPTLLLPEVEMFRGMARLLALEARLAIAENQIQQATRSLQAGFTLAHYLACGPTRFHLLVGIHLGNLFLDGLEQLQQLTNGPNLYWSLVGLPHPFCNLKPAVENERNMVLRMFPTLRKLRTGPVGTDILTLLDAELDEWVEDLEVMGNWRDFRSLARTGSLPSAEKKLKALGRPASQIARMKPTQIVLLAAMDDHEANMVRMERLMQMPYWEGRPAAERTFPDYQSTAVRLDALLTGGILVQLDFNEGFLDYWTAATKLDRRIAAMIQIETIRDSVARGEWNRESGKTAPKGLAKRSDPVTGQPFQVMTESDGFQLGSQDGSFRIRVTFRN